MLGHEIRPNKCQRMFFDHSAINLEIVNKNNRQSLYVWKLGNTLPNNIWVKIIWIFENILNTVRRILKFVECS